jgi:3-dehydroquinate dehydratase-2
MKIAIINGPNLNFLGIREPEIYGHETLKQLMDGLNEKYTDLNLVYFQSNHEGELIDFIQGCFVDGFDGLVINPGGLAHTSIVLSDALKSVNIPTVEVHVSNIYKRESFRHHSYTAASCIGVISGLGFRGYDLAIQYLLEY